MKQRIFKISIFLSCLISLTSCEGYNSGAGSLSQYYSSVTVPYVKGDGQGKLTNAVIEELMSSGSFKYERDGGDLTVDLEIVNYAVDTIGFRRERGVGGALKERLIPSENRLQVTVLLRLTESASGRTILGPIRLQSDVDYEYLFEEIGSPIINDSLGQLDFADNARHIAMMPAEQAIAYKVIQYIENVW
jgi:hypothetical protein